MAPKIQWPLVLFSLLAGIGGCTFAFAGLANALGEAASVTLTATIVALAFVIAGGICSVAHLATPKNAWAAVTHIFSFSGISVELIMLGVNCACMAGYCLAVVLNWSDVVRMALGLGGMLAGIWLAFATGHGYLISSKPTWNTMKLPVAYTGTALASGGMLYLLVAMIMQADDRTTSVLVIAVIASAVFSIIALSVYLAHLGGATTRTNKRLYHVGLIACGIVVTAVSALALGLATLALGSPNGICAAAALVGFAASFVGGLALRMLMWIVGAGFLSFFDHAQAHRSAILNH